MTERSSDRAIERSSEGSDAVPIFTYVKQMSKAKLSSGSRHTTSEILRLLTASFDVSHGLIEPDTNSIVGTELDDSL